jgi:hypothetical protein
MSDKADTITQQIYRKLEHLVDNVYRKRGISAEHTRNYLSNKKNLETLLKGMSELELLYNKLNHEISFEDKVKEILFKRIIPDRIYFEKDNPQNERIVTSYSTFIKS